MSKRLRIHLGYQGESTTQESVTTVPVEILDVDGGTLARLTLRPQRLTEFAVPDGTPDPILIRATLPSGEQRVKRATFGTESTVELSVLDDYASPNEWLNWSRPLVRLGRLRHLHFNSTAIGDLWIGLWQKTDVGWAPTTLNPQQHQTEPYATQFDLQLATGGYLLHVGGTKLAWRFVAIPGGGLVRILLSPNPSTDPRAEPVRITWSRLKPDEEALLAFLASDAIGQANTVATEPQVAERLLFGKYSDPISACVGAYFLVKTGQLSRLHDWPSNLYHDFQWLSDGALIFATQLLRAGSPDIVSAAEAVRTALARGLPIFADGLRLLHESVQLLAATPLGQEMSSVKDGIQRYVLAQAWSSYALSFYGSAPDKPTPDRIVGPPDSPRSAILRRTVAKVRGPTESSSEVLSGVVVERSLGSESEPPARWRKAPAADVAADRSLASVSLRVAT
jgi:hypothetical protein